MFDRIKKVKKGKAVAKPLAKQLLQKLQLRVALSARRFSIARRSDRRLQLLYL